MYQIIEGIDNEVLLVFFVLTVFVAVIVPLYILRPRASQNNEANVQSRRSEEVRNLLSSSAVAEPAASPLASSQARNRLGIDATESSLGIVDPPQVESLYPGLDSLSRDVADSSRNEASGSSRPVNTSLRDGVPLPAGVSDRPHVAGPSDARVEGDLPPSSASEESDLITVRVIHHENSQTLSVRKDLTLGELKRIAFPAESTAGKLIRFILHGRVLNGDTYPLRYLGVMNSSVLHASISDGPTAAPSVGSPDEPGLDLSGMFVPLVVGSVALSWTLVFFYGTYFSASSVAILGFLTLLFAVLIIAR